MTEELKFRIENASELEKRVLDFGARFVEEISSTEVYFNQPSGRVLKIKQSKQGNFLIELEKKDAGFRYLREEKITDVEKIKKQLENTYGVHRVQKKKIRYFRYQNFQLDFIAIEDLGDFFVIEGDKVSQKVVSHLFGTSVPENITVSFDQLKKGSRGDYPNY